MYIIDEADIIIDDQMKKASLFIKGNTIFGMRSNYKRDKHLKMDVSSFVMTPTFVMLDFSMPAQSFDLLKKHYVDRCLLKGCTTVISVFDIEFEQQFDDALSRKRISLLNAPVDYVLGVKIPLKRISTTFIRKCKKQKIPIIFVDIFDDTEIHTVPWGWIKESMFPYNPVLVPFLHTENDYQKQRWLKEWKKVMSKEKIPSLFDEIPENTPISLENLKKFGLYPKRGDLHIGGEINYNLYLKGMHAGKQRSSYKNSPDVVVHKGQITASGGQAFFRPGYGEEIIVQRTALFI